MFPDNRPQISLERRVHTITPVNANEAVAVEMHLGMPTGLIDAVHLKAGRT
jgi:hypothetical protein